MSWRSCRGEIQQPVSLVYRDQLFPRTAYRLMFDFLCQELPERAACKLMVALLSLAHDRSCEAQLAGLLAEDLEQRRLPDITALLGCFAPDPARLPEVCSPSSRTRKAGLRPGC